MFKAQTEDKESLQALAFSLRQEKGSDITFDEVKNAMLGYMALPPSVRESCGINEQKLISRFNNWASLGDEDDVNGWINSSMWTANAIIGTHVPARGDYIFYNTIGDPIFRGAYKKIAQDIARNAKNSVVKRVYANVSQGTGDKWNPADVIAIKKNKSSEVIKEWEKFKDGKSNYKSKTTIQEENNKLRNNRKNDISLNLVDDMSKLFDFNQYVDELYERDICIPISLKKVAPTAKELQEVTTPNVNVDKFESKASEAIKKSIELNIKITSVDYKPNGMKCVVNFTLAGESGHFMDIRGFESSKKVANVQMQLQKGTAANHGKATLPAFSLITVLSDGLRAINTAKKMRNTIFGKTSIPTSSDHKFTDYQLFNDYAFNKKGRFSQNSIMSDTPLWAEYCNKLSTDKMSIKKFLDEFAKKFGTANNYKDAAKYLKNKVQSYEVGYVLDKGKGQISELVKENIMKSVYSLAASKGFRIFGDNKITDYMTASSYIKVGG
tara:strand:+ start:50 stop:1537 length:1488 start_codon:yes stop_codon:yes gene_type:complete